jgi:hypothetical protein
MRRAADARRISKETYNMKNAFCAAVVVTAALFLGHLPGAHAAPELHRCAHGPAAHLDPAARLFLVNGCTPAKTDGAPQLECSLSEVSSCQAEESTPETRRAFWPLLGHARSSRHIEPGVLEAPTEGRIFWVTVNDRGFVRRAALATEETCSL